MNLTVNFYGGEITGATDLFTPIPTQLNNVQYKITNDNRRLKAGNWEVRVVRTAANVRIRVEHWLSDGSKRDMKTRSYNYADGSLTLKEFPSLKVESNLIGLSHMLESRFGITDFSREDSNGKFTVIADPNGDRYFGIGEITWVCTDGEIDCTEKQLLEKLQEGSCPYELYIRHSTWTVVCTKMMSQQGSIKKQITLRTSAENVFFLTGHLEKYLSDRDLYGFDAVFELFEK